MNATEKKRFIQTDDEGYFKFGETRVTDADVGRKMFQNLRLDDQNRLVTDVEGVEAFVEAFDEPLVALQVEKQGKDQLRLQMPYGFSETVSVKDLRLDEWDRFHGVTAKKIPFVFSRPAQAAFFNLLEEYTDTSITLEGVELEVPPLFADTKEVDGPKFWSTKYQEAQPPGWDLDAPTPILKDILAQLKLPRSRILVLGAGAGHDAAFLREQGHLVTAVDISPEAEQKFRTLYAQHEDINYIVADLFNLSPKMNSSYDVIFEHTCFCAVNPTRRQDLVNIWTRLLNDKGHLLGIFYIKPQTSGPPFGATEWEIQQRLKKKFEFLYWTRWKNSVPRRVGQELVVYAQKK